MNRAPSLILHASAIAYHGRGVLIRGASGTGKSSLALALLARGAQLIADDRTCLRDRDGALLAWSPDAILGKIEARGIGILRVQAAPPTPIVLIVDLDMTEPERLPPMRTDSIDGVTLPLILACGHPEPADAVLLLLAGARLA